MGNKKLKWTTEEEVALLAGVAKHGPGKWKNILCDPEFSDQLSNRSNIGLKDKWRNLSDASCNQGSKDKIRTTKIKAAAFQLAPAATAATSTSNSSQLPPLPRTGLSDLNIDDSCNIVLDPNNTPKYDRMIFEALSAMADPNGSDVSAIFNFIQQRHEVSPNFRNILSSRLRRLVAQCKLVKVNHFKSRHNLYKMNDSLGTRTHFAGRPKEMNVKPRKMNSQGLAHEMVGKASITAAYELVEVENKLDVVKGAVEEIERMTKLAEQAEYILQIAKEIYEECSQGKIVELN